MRAQGFFITGTDTGIGKTWATLALMQAFKDAGNKVAGMKPVASGCGEVAGKLRNEDALLIQAHGSIPLPYELINPYALKEPVAPHIAAELAGVNIEFDPVVGAYNQLAAQHDIIIVEGIGGWRVPLTGGRTVVDLVRALRLPVVLVVGLRLGCINHALLTSEIIRSDGVQLAGWVANCVEKDYMEPEKTLLTLAKSIPAPLLGSFPHLPYCDAEMLGRNLCVNRLRGDWSGA